jgi:peptide/nickel transport system ATP-binding protein
MNNVLEVENLKVYYKGVTGEYRAVDGVTFEVRKKEVFGIAGESGCGKSTLVEGVLRIIKPPGYIAGGKVTFDGIDLLKLKGEELRKIRWKKLSYIPQGSMNSLNPILKVKDQIIDVITTNSDISKKEAEKEIPDLLESVGLAKDVSEMYPHELSGGMKQRVIIAAATALKPDLIVADEPVTALDLVVQRGILQIIAELRDKNDVAILFVAHDMAVHAELVDRLAIMYAGLIMEIGPVIDVFKDPLNPYTKLLIDAIPSITKKKIKGIPGISPSLFNWPEGCRFHPRCPFAKDLCKTELPKLRNVGKDRFVACHLVGELK